MTPLFKKLNLTAHTQIVVLNAPDSFEGELEQLSGVAVLRKVGKTTRVSFAMAFATNQKQLDAASKSLTAAAEGDAILWMCYPKQSSKKYKCDFNRDSGWTVLGEAGYEPVRMVAIDEDWSALRFRKVENIKTLTRNKTMAISKEGKKRAAKKSSPKSK
jgi:hypothetical protein